MLSVDSVCSPCTELTTTTKRGNRQSRPLAAFQGWDAAGRGVELRRMGPIHMLLATIALAKTPVFYDEAKRLLLGLLSMFSST